MAEIGLYDLILESDVKNVANFLDLTIRALNRVFFQDSIYEFYPYAEIFIQDSTGDIVDQLGFIEGLEFEAGFGNTDVGYIGHKYAWQGNQILNTKVVDHTSGSNAFILTSVYKKKGNIKSRAWQDKISNIIVDIMKQDYSLAVNDSKGNQQLFIEPTDGVDWWYQCNQNNYDFIEDIVKRAHNVNNDKSPYITFFNTNGEFYFGSIAWLMNQPVINPLDDNTQKPIPYRLVFDAQEGLRDPSIIQGYDIVFTGFETNRKNYQIKSYSRNATGASVSQTDKITEHIYKGAKQVVPLSKDVIVDSRVVEFGIYETTDLDALKGQINNYFIDSNLNIRIDMSLLFNPELVSGKTIEIEIGSSDQKKAFELKELSGKWLIANTRHYLDSDGHPFTSLEIVRSAVFVDPKHPFSKVYE